MLGSLQCTVGQSVVLDQVNDLTIMSEVNITQIPEKYLDDVLKLFRDENITVIYDVANISGEVFCFDAADPVKEALTTYTSLSDEFNCATCGEKLILVHFA